MYFEDISSDELKPFHGLFGVDFSISLTDLLTSNLFKVETVITDKLYRVYPLFYCNEVTSNNPDDKTSNVKCLILSRMDHETYLSFKTKMGDVKHVIDDSYTMIKNIGDNLTTAEFNSIVYRIRKNTRLNGALNFDNENHHVTDNDIQTTFKLQGIYEHRRIKGIKLTGDANKPIDNTSVSNKTFHLYNYDGTEWKFIKSINTDNNGEYSFIDYSISTFIDNSEIGTSSELQSLIDNAIQAEETEITLEKQYKFTSRNPIIINSPIKINGNGHIIDGAGTSRLFDISADNVTLNNLILQNGNSGTMDGNGGAIQWTGNNGVLNNTVIANCISNTNGGAVYWTGDNGEIRNCRFVHNATNGNGGALYLESSVKFTSIDVVSFNNFANGDGGCVYALGGNQYWQNWIIQKDTTNGGTYSTFKVEGDNINISGFDVSELFYGRNFIDYTSHAVNNKVEYKIVPSTWVTNPEDYTITNSFNLISKTSNTNKGTRQGLTRLTGLYGDYHFINSHRLHNNQGLIINDSLKNKPLRVKLINPYFRFANYNLTFTVMSITGANIFEDDTQDNIVTDSFTVLLETDEEVIIDVSEYSNDSILLFDVDTNIDFNRHEIIYPPSLRLASNKESVKLNESITLTCKYTDDENKPVTGAVITFKESNINISVGVTNNEGIATITYAPQVLRDYSFTAICNDLMSNTVSVTVESFDDLTLTSDKDILSYNGGTNPDTATLTAQLTYEGEPVAVSGETVTFEVRKQSDDSLVETLSDVTDGSGVATVSYTSKGAGDLYIKAECSLLTKTYGIRDCIAYDDATSDKSSKFILNNMSITHNVDHYEATTSNGNATLILADYTGDFEAEFDMQSSTTGMGYGLFTHLNSHYDALYSKQWGTSIMIYQSNSSGSESNKRTINHNRSNNWYHIKVTKQNGTVTFVYSLNGNTIYTYTQSFTSNSMLGLINNYNNVTFSFKNIIIKTL